MIQLLVKLNNNEKSELKLMHIFLDLRSCYVVM